MTALAITTGARIGIIAVAGVLLWFALAAMAAGYGGSKGFPFFPLFVSAIFLGPVGWALVLLAVTIGAGPRRASTYEQPVPPRTEAGPMLRDLRPDP